MAEAVRCPGCETELSGLARFCYHCGTYIADIEGRQAVAEEAPDALADDLAEGRQLLVLPLPPTSNLMWRSVAGVRKGLVDAVLAYKEGRGPWTDVLKSVYPGVKMSKSGTRFKKDAAEWLNAQRTKMIEGDVRLMVTFYFERNAGDLDNRIKPLLDVLQHVVFEDDKQVTELHAVKRFDKERPRCVVIVEADDGLATLDPGAEFQFEMAF